MTSFRLPLVAAGLLAVVGWQNPVRDGGVRPDTTGTAAIAGVVIATDAAKTPIRRVTVTLNGGDVTNVLAVTDDAGRFTFRNLPSGRYTLSLSRPGYVSTAFGATKPGRAGVPIPLGEGEQFTATIPMLRGGVIAGTITDLNGEAAIAAGVAAVPFVTQSDGERRWTSSGILRDEPVDARGNFRLYGLAPGDYIVVARPDRRILAAAVSETSEADFQAALQPTRAAGAAPVPPAPRPPSSPSSGPAPVYFPGTVSAAEARAIHIGSAEEVAGVNFVMRLASLGRITGVVLTPDGQPATGATVRLSAVRSVPQFGPMMTASVGSGRDGRFILNSVQPGSYVVTAQLAAAPGGGGASPAAGVLTGFVEVTTDGRESDVSITLRRGVRVDGRLLFETRGVLTPPTDASRVRISLSPALRAEGEYVVFGAGPAVMPDAAGAFVFPSVEPGRYRPTITVPGGTPANPGWFVKSVMVNGREWSDAMIAVGADAAANIVVTLTDRPTEVSGTMQDASGRPAPEYFLVAFPEDRSLWRPQSPHIQQLRPGADGSFAFRGLPPGAYLIAAVTDVEPADLADPVFLESLRSSSSAVTVAEGEKKTLNLRVK